MESGQIFRVGASILLSADNFFGESDDMSTFSKQISFQTCRHLIRPAYLSSSQPGNQKSPKLPDDQS